jgi:hypothetical protein
MSGAGSFESSSAGSAFSDSLTSKPVATSTSSSAAGRFIAEAGLDLTAAVDFLEAAAAIDGEVVPGPGPDLVAMEEAATKGFSSSSSGRSVTLPTGIALHLLRIPTLDLMRQNLAVASSQISM